MIIPFLLCASLAAAAPPGAVPSAGDPVPSPAAPAPGTSSTDLTTSLGKLGLPLVLSLTERPRAILVLVSGDGGWSRLDKTFAAYLATRGVSTIGLNAMKYFWDERRPEEAAADLRRLIDAARGGGAPVFAGGYSFGAEVVPVVLDRPERGADGVTGLVLIAPGPYASFEVHLTDWLRSKEKPTPHRVLDHLRHLADLPVLCLAPESDEESVCPSLDGEARREVVLLPGSHHFGGDYERLGQEALRFIEAMVAGPPPAARGAPRRDSRTPRGHPAGSPGPDPSPLPCSSLRGRGPRRPDDRSRPGRTPRRRGSAPAGHPR